MQSMRITLLMAFFFLFRTVPSFGESATEILDSIVGKMRQGETISNIDRDRAQQAYDSYFQAMNKKRGAPEWNYLPAQDRADLFMNVLRVSLVHPERYEYAPIRWCRRLAPSAGLMHQLDQKYDAFLLFSTILPAHYIGDNGHTIRAIRKLMADDPFLAGQAVLLSSKLERHSWIIQELIDLDDWETVKKAVALVGKNESNAWTETLAYMHERLGELSAAEEKYKRVSSPEESLRPLIGFYLRNSFVLDQKGVSYGNKLTALRDEIFPEGLLSVGLHSFSGPPGKGVVVTRRNAFTMPINTVIVAVDGFAVSSMEQYKFVRDLDPDHPTMDLILWNGEHYVSSVADFGVFRSRYGLPNRWFGTCLYWESLK